MNLLDPDIVATVENFLTRSRFPHVEWVKFKLMKLYFRRSKRLYGTGLNNRARIGDALDLANIELNMKLPPVRRAWLFMQAIVAIEHVCETRKLSFYVENVHTPEIAGFFRRRRYREHRDSEGVPSFFRA